MLDSIVLANCTDFFFFGEGYSVGICYFIHICSITKNVHYATVGSPLPMEQ